MNCQNRCVLITGASSGIGYACAQAFAEAGANLLLCARSLEKLNQLAKKLQAQHNVKVYAFALDVTDVNAVHDALEKLPSEWQAIDILVNNAGLALGLETIYEGKINDWERMIDTNIKGLLYVTKFVVAKMVNQNRGHVINIGSISSHQVYPGGAVYCATKFAERAISEGLKMDVHGTPIRVTSIDPGMVETQFALTRFAGDAKKAEAVYHGMTPLSAEDVADAVLFCATRPAHVDIREIKIYPTDQTSAQMCHRRPARQEND